MAYRIDPTESTAAEIRRILNEELGRAVVELRTPDGPDAGQIHDVRKRLKKARSVLRLARGDLGPAVVRHANSELRDVGGLLATQRDADSLVEAVDRLLADAEKVETETVDGDNVVTPMVDSETVEALGVLRTVLAERADTARQSGAVSRSLVLGCARRLTETQVWLDRVPPQTTGWDALAPGFERQYRRGRKLLGDLPDQPTTDELHEWRKRAKDLWYHQRLLKRLWPDAQRPIRHAAAHVCDLLGDDHDLGVLLDHLEPGHQLDGALEQHHRDLVVDHITRARDSLQAEARPLGHLLYADSAPAWAARHGSWWESVNRDGPAPNPSPETALA